MRDAGDNLTDDGDLASRGVRASDVGARAAEVPDSGERPRGSQPPRASQPSPAPVRPSHAPRASRPSHPSHPERRALRIVFSVLWVGTQIALILTAARRPDGAFGFRMFPDSSTVRVALYREVVDARGERVRVHVDDGVWGAADAGGLRRLFAWNDRVRRRELEIFDTETSARYGADAHLARLQAALDDVAAHIPDDAETHRLLLDVTLRRNGREPKLIRMASAERLPGGG